MIGRLKEDAKDKTKGYWNEAIAFTATDNTLIHVSYLESLFYKQTQKAERYIVKNHNMPSPGNLLEESECTLAEYVYHVNLVLIVLNYKVLEPLIDENIDDENIFYIHRKKKAGQQEIEAKCRKTRDGFDVLKGSYIYENVGKKIPLYIEELRCKANIDKNTRLLQEDILFSNPSAASKFVLGVSDNGRTTWKNKDGKSVKEIFFN